MKVVSLVFLWGKMRTVAHETASQIVLRNCVEEVGGKVSVCDFGEREEHAIRHIFFFSFCRRFLPATRVVITRKDFSVCFFLI